MKQWKQLRFLFLFVTLVSTLLVLVRVLLAKPIDKPKPEEIRGKANILKTTHLPHPSTVLQFRGNFRTVGTED
jgi:hypothetical protein